MCEYYVCDSGEIVVSVELPGSSSIINWYNARIGIRRNICEETLSVPKPENKKRGVYPDKVMMCEKANPCNFSDYMSLCFANYKLSVIHYI